MNYLVPVIVLGSAVLVVGIVAAFVVVVAIVHFPRNVHLTEEFDWGWGWWYHYWNAIVLVNYVCLNLMGLTYR